MSRARAAGLWVGLLLLTASASALGGCGDADEEPAAPRTASTPAGDGAIELSIRHDDGAGNRETGILECSGSEQRAGGFLTRRPAVSELCEKARSIKGLLTTQPDKGRVCTQVYGGPQTARVSGTIDGEKVDRRFERTNGCEIADFDRAGELLQP